MNLLTLGRLKQRKVGCRQTTVAESLLPVSSPGVTDSVLRTSEVKSENKAKEVNMGKGRKESSL